MSKLEYRAIQELKYKRGQIDRRTFVRSLLATGVALPSALSLAGQVAASTPKSGGRFRMGLGHGSTTDTLDSATSENHFTLVNGYTFGNHLTEVSNTGELIPELAESFESDDAQKWVFNLRQGVEFHNGKTMTSEDVVASYNHHMGEDSTSAAKGLLTQVKSLKADGKNKKRAKNTGICINPGIQPPIGLAPAFRYNDIISCCLFMALSLNFRLISSNSGFKIFIFACDK